MASVCSGRNATGLLSLLISLAMYIVGAALVYLILGIFSVGGFLGFLFGLIRWIVNIYVTLGIIYSFLKFFDIPGKS